MPMIEIRQTEAFSSWLETLKDQRGKAKIAARIRRLVFGNAGDVAAVGSGVSELRIHFGPGYRIYFVRRGKALVVLLAGGTKRTQSRDIVQAIALAAQL